MGVISMSELERDLGMGFGPFREEDQQSRRRALVGGYVKRFIGTPLKKFRYVVCRKALVYINKALLVILPAHMLNAIIVCITHYLSTGEALKTREVFEYINSVSGFDLINMNAPLIVNPTSMYGLSQILNSMLYSDFLMWSILMIMPGMGLMMMVFLLREGLFTPKGMKGWETQ